jgi:threonine/homoserine/homoserine lactone efflux protein
VPYFPALPIQLFFKGLGLGLAIAAPVGPIALLCIRRTLTQGPWVGLATGLGAATADGLYATMAAFGSTLLLTLSNPATILSFIAIFAGLGLDSQGEGWLRALSLVLGVVGGSALWWLGLTWGSNMVASLRHPPTARLVPLRRWSCPTQLWPGHVIPSLDSPIGKHSHDPLAPLVSLTLRSFSRV